MLWKKKRTKVVLTDCGNGIAKIHIKGSSVRAAAMLTAALVKELNAIRRPEKTNDELANVVRSMVLIGLEDEANAEK